MVQWSKGARFCCLAPLTILLCGTLSSRPRAPSTIEHAFASGRSTAWCAGSVQGFRGLRVALMVGRVARWHLASASIVAFAGYRPRDRRDRYASHPCLSHTSDGTRLLAFIGSAASGARIRGGHPVPAPGHTLCTRETARLSPHLARCSGVTPTVASLSVGAGRLLDRRPTT